MDRFLLSYNGNKYLESKKMCDDIDFSSYDYICEPFCGIFGFSRFAYNKGFTGDFLLNDLDEDIIKIFNDLKVDIDTVCDKLKAELSKYKVDRELTNDRNKSRLLHLSSRGGLGSLCKIQKGNTKITNFLKKKGQYNLFFNKCTFSSMDYIDFIKSIPDDKKVLIYYDPPYFNSDNTGYHPNTSNAVGYSDGTKKYIDILNNFKDIKHDQLLILNHTDIMHYIFKDFFKSKLVSKYQNIGKNIKIHNRYQTF